MNAQLRALCLIVGCALVSCNSTTASAPSTTATADFSKSAVQVVANGCSSIEVHGAGLMVGEGRIATVAHVVAGSKSVEVRGVFGTAQATIVYFDPVLDLAVLKVNPTLAAPVAIGSAAAGDKGDVIVYRQGAPVELPVSVERPVNIRTGDIYLQGTHIRPGYELNLDIQAGDSGAVVVIGGKAIALVWATSREAKGRVWAMQASLLADHLTGETAVDHGACA